MEKYSLEAARREAEEIKTEANKIKGERDESGEPSNDDYKKADEMITESKESEFYTKTKNGFKALCETQDDPAIRTDYVLEQVNIFLQRVDRELLSEEKIKEIRDNIGACSLIQDKNKYLEMIMESLKPIFKARETDMASFEYNIAKARNEYKGWPEINRLVSYGKSGPNIHIHFSEGKTVSNKRSLYLQAMRKLAKIVNDDEEIQTITGTSPIVAEHPELPERFGFDISDITQEEKEKYFPGFEGDVKRAKISRKKFLENFLKK